MRVGMPRCKRGGFVVGIGLTAQVAFRYQDRIRGGNKKRNPTFTVPPIAHRPFLGRLLPETERLVIPL